MSGSCLNCPYNDPFNEVCNLSDEEFESLTLDEMRALPCSSKGATE